MASGLVGVASYLDLGFGILRGLFPVSLIGVFLPKRRMGWMGETPNTAFAVGLLLAINLFSEAQPESCPYRRTAEDTGFGRANRTNRMQHPSALPGITRECLGGCSSTQSDSCT